MAHSMFNVFFGGAHSTGKSTLQRAVTEVTFLEPVTEVARGLIRDMGLQRQDFDPETHPAAFEELQLRIMQAQCQVERKNIQENRSCLYDRCIDPVVYALTFLGEDAAERLLQHPATVESIGRYRESLVFVITPQTECIQDDGFRLRPVLPELEKYTTLMRQLLERLNIAYILIETLDINERVKVVTEQLQKYRPELLIV